LLDYDVAKIIIPHLVRQGADINQRSDPVGVIANVPTFEVTPLHIVAENNEIDARTIEILFDAGADPTIKNANGLTPLDVALKSSNTEAIRELERWGDEADDDSEVGVTDPH